MASFSSSATLLLRPTSGRSLRLLQKSFHPFPSSSSSSSLTNPRNAPHLHHHHNHHHHNRSPWFLRAVPSPVPEPPSPKDPVAGLQVVLSRIQDRLRIFFAVLFWMSLFFWGSAWDGRDNSKKKRGPWLKK